MSASTTSREFFDQKYREVPDPWAFATSEYEQARYDVVMAALAGRHFHRSFEPGCSIGVLTERLAAITDLLVAMEISPVAAGAARIRTSRFAHVDIRCGNLAADLPEGAFDLIALVEVGYYFKADDLLSIAGKLVDKLSPGGCFLAEHWLGISDDHLLHGDVVHQILCSLDGLKHDLNIRQEAFRLDRWTRI